MANIKFTNFARSTLAIGAASGATSLTLASTTGSRFPALGAGEYFYLTLENASLVREIVKVTARAGDVLTVVRAQDNTTAQTWNAGDVASLRFNAAAIEESVLGTLLTANNLSDVANAATARTNLGLAIGVNVQAYNAANAVTNAAQTFTATQTPDNGTAAVSTTSSYVFDGADQIREITLTNAITVTFGAPTGITQYAMYKFILKAGDTSARTFAWNAAYKFPAATSPLTSGTTTNGAFDIITFIGGASNTLIYDGVQRDVR